MRFMMLVIPKGYESAEPGTLPSVEDVEKMDKYNRELQASGRLVWNMRLGPDVPRASRFTTTAISFAQGCSAQKSRAPSRRCASTWALLRPACASGSAGRRSSGTGRWLIDAVSPAAALQRAGLRVQA